MKQVSYGPEKHQNSSHESIKYISLLNKLCFLYIYILEKERLLGLVHVLHVDDQIESNFLVMKGCTLVQNYFGAYWEYCWVCKCCWYYLGVF